MKNNMVPLEGLHQNSMLVLSTVQTLPVLRVHVGNMVLTLVDITFGSEGLDCWSHASDALDGHVPGTRLMRLRSPGDSSMAIRLGKNMTDVRPGYA